MKPWPIATLIPHAGAMILLDAVSEHGADHITCTRRVPPSGLLHAADGSLPAWAGIELMAQAIAAWAGCVGRATGQPVRLGFLLGTRHYTCNVTAFAPGTELVIEARREFSDAAGMGMFACRITACGIEASARLAVFSPPDAASMLSNPDPAPVP